MAADTTPAWEVTGQRPDFRQGPSGAYEEGILVAFRTRLGAVGQVFVTNAQYSAAAVREAVNRAASAMDEVAQLKG